MTDLIKSSTPILRIVVLGGFLAGVVIGALGILLVFQGDNAETEFSFFGQTFKSQSVGIAAIFMGACIIVLVIRRALKSVDKAITADAAHPLSVNHANTDEHSTSLQYVQNGSASIVLKLSDEVQNTNLEFGLLHVRDGKDQVSDKGPLLNKEISFKEIDRQGTVVAQVTYAKHIGFQFKCFVDHKGTSFDTVKDLLSINGYIGISKGGGKPFRAWFLLPDYNTCLTIDGITNNFYYPA
ncbi:MAG: hypothetical protein JSU63_15895 [Phycisphaerales bacterium]|nr:MAG: hypothetical protein JSU63_15895 [Phycisphaerales bacterium]